VILVIGIGLLYITGHSYLLKGIRKVYLKGHSSAYIEDWPYFNNRSIAKCKTKQAAAWPLAVNYNESQSTSGLKKLHNNYKTTAFLVIKSGEIWHETYADGYDK